MESKLTKSSPNSHPVSIFIPSLRGGGAERAMLQFAEGLVLNGYRVDLIVACADGALGAKIPLQVNLISLNCRRTVSAIFPLVKYLRSTRPLALFSTIPHANLVATIAKVLSRSRTPLVIRESNSPTTESKRSLGRKIVHSLVPYLYPLADGVIAVSEGVALELRSLEREKGAFKIKVLPTPVVSSAMLKDAELQIECAWVNESNLPIILGCGRLVPAKGFDILIKAFALVRPHIKSRLLILGEGPDRVELENLAKDLGVADSVLFPGFVLNPFPYFKRARVFVLSSRFEGMPNVLLQALALGTAVVSTDCKSGPRECLQSGALGRLVSVDNVEEMALAIEQTLLAGPSNDVSSIIGKAYSIESCARGYMDFAFESAQS